jgi:hypothetical protein
MNLGRENKNAVNSRKATEQGGRVKRMLSITKKKKQLNVINENDFSNELKNKAKTGNMETTKNNRKISVSMTFPDAIQAVLALRTYSDDKGSDDQTNTEPFNLSVLSKEKYTRSETRHTRYTEKNTRQGFEKVLGSFENKQNSQSCPFLNGNESVNNYLSLQEDSDICIPLETSTNFDQLRRFSSAREDIKCLLDDASRTVER